MSQVDQASKPAPSNWTRISSAIFYDDAPAAIDWLCRTFGFEVRIRVDDENGDVVHSELTFGDGIVMVSGTSGRERRDPPVPSASPRSSGVMTQALLVYVDDVDRHHEASRAAGATIADEPTTQDYGEDYWADRSYRVIDCEGHHWWFAQRLRG